MTAVSLNEEFIIDSLFADILSLPTDEYHCENEDNFEEFAKRMGLITDNTTCLEEKDIKGRISLAYEKLSEIPKTIADRFADTTKILDLSYNNITDLSFLVNFTGLNSLILDKNSTLNEKTLPRLPSLRLLWLNNCEIENITRWVYKIQDNCPSIKHLSLMGNPGANSLFNGGTVFEQNHYRLFVISQLQTLDHLDDTVVTITQRSQAKSQKLIYNFANAFKFIEKFNQTRKIRKRRQKKITFIEIQNVLCTEGDSTD